MLFYFNTVKGLEKSSLLMGCAVNMCICINTIDRLIRVIYTNMLARDETQFQINMINEDSKILTWKLEFIWM